MPGFWQNPNNPSEVGFYRPMGTVITETPFEDWERDFYIRWEFDGSARWDYDLPLTDWVTQTSLYTTNYNTLASNPSHNNGKIPHFWDVQNNTESQYIDIIPCKATYTNDPYLFDAIGGSSQTESIAEYNGLSTQVYEREPPQYGGPSELYAVYMGLGERFINGLWHKFGGHNWRDEQTMTEIVEYEVPTQYWQGGTTGTIHIDDSFSHCYWAATDFGSAYWYSTANAGFGKEVPIKG